MITNVLSTAVTFRLFFLRLSHARITQNLQTCTRWVNSEEYSVDTFANPDFAREISSRPDRLSASGSRAISRCGCVHFTKSIQYGAKFSHLFSRCAKDNNIQIHESNQWCVTCHGVLMLLPRPLPHPDIKTLVNSLAHTSRFFNPEKTVSFGITELATQWAFQGRF